MWRTVEKNDPSTSLFGIMRLGERWHSDIEGHLFIFHFSRSSRILRDYTLYGPQHEKTCLWGLANKAQCDQRLCYSLNGKYHI